MAMPFDTLQSCAVQLPGSRMRESRCSLLGDFVRPHSDNGAMLGRGVQVALQRRVSLDY
jgi:hypothetical protein